MPEVPIAWLASALKPGFGIRSDAQWRRRWHRQLSWQGTAPALALALARSWHGNGGAVLSSARAESIGRPKSSRGVLTRSAPEGYSRGVLPRGTHAGYSEYSHSTVLSSARAESAGHAETDTNCRALSSHLESTV